MDIHFLSLDIMHCKSLGANFQVDYLTSFSWGDFGSWEDYWLQSITWFTVDWKNLNKLSEDKFPPQGLWEAEERRRECVTGMNLLNWIHLCAWMIRLTFMRKAFDSLKPKSCELKINVSTHWVVVLTSLTGEYDDYKEMHKKNESEWVDVEKWHNMKLILRSLWS